MNYIFCQGGGGEGGGGGGAGDQKNKYVWRYDEIIIFFLRSGGSFLSIWGFLRSMFRFENVFGVAKVRICFGYA